MKLAALALAAVTLFAAPAAAGTPAAAARRAIVIAEDQRRWSDGELRGYLAHADAAVRARAARAVGRLQDSTSVDALLPLLRDPDVPVRREAAFALGQLGRREARVALEAALADPDADVADLALEALGKLGDRAATARVVALLESPSARLRGDAAVALWRLADTTAAPALIARLGEPDAAVRWRVVYALEKLPARAARIVPAVKPLLHDRDALVRAHAARTLGRMKSREATRALLAELHDRDAAVVVNALRALQSIADSGATRTLATMRHSLGHRDPYVRVTAATALAERFAWVTSAPLDSEAARGALERRLEDDDAATRGACARALVTRFGAEALPLARTLLTDSSVYARIGLLDGFRQRGDAALAAPVLDRALDDSWREDAIVLEWIMAAEVTGQLAAHDPGHALARVLGQLRSDAGTTVDLQESSQELHVPGGMGTPPSPAAVLALSADVGALADAGDSTSVPLLARAYAAFARYPDADARQSIRDALRALAGRAFADSIEHANSPARTAPEAPPFSEDFENGPTERGAILHTTAGDITWEFLGDDAPQTVRNFVKLARAHYFDGQHVHRVVPDFVIQDGDPTGTGSGGPGWTIRCEYNPRRYEAGMVGMALSGKDTGGSQWFVTLAPQPHLDGRYTIFARVTRGLDVARRVTQGTVIQRVEVLP